MGRPRVLFVEDEFLIRMTLSEAMADEGFDVAEAGSGDEALEMLREERFALLLTDVQLPGELDGLSLVGRARDIDPGLPVIYMTGRPDTMPNLLDPSMETVIPKPYVPSAVCAAARRMVRT